ncbi:MAG: serine/threonine protein kinase [Planctomycetes bacterium]|nr:serine/threonine protein kinase [Planctomycetota bacterium]
MMDEETVRGLVSLFEVASRFVEGFPGDAGSLAHKEILARHSQVRSAISRIEKTLEKSVVPGEASAAGIARAAEEGWFVPLVSEALSGIAEIRRLGSSGSLEGASELAEEIDTILEGDRDLEDAIEQASTLWGPAAPGGSVALLSVVKGKANRARFAVCEGDVALIGSGPGSDLAFEDPTISSSCCRIACRDGLALIEALDPLSPVLVGGHRATRARLENLDVVRLSPESQIQVILAAPSLPRRSPSGRVVAKDPIDDSQIARLAPGPCAGDCGRIVGPREIAADEAAAVEDSFYCFACVARGRGPFEIVDDYRIVQRLAQGGMGEVYLAVETSNARPVAVKMLRGALASDVRSVERFCREAKILLCLSHPNIVRCLGSGVYERAPYLVMEYVAGKTIRRHLDRKGRLDLPLAVQVAYQLTKALDHAHAHEIIHRDVKPENVLLDRQGTVRLLDLGLAKSLGASGVLTGSHVLMGTLYYIPPEQIADAGHVDHRADIYSLGATLYEMATGVRPFSEGGRGDVFSRILSGRLTPLAEHLPGAPEELDGIVRRSMALDRDLRYASASQLGQDLKRLYKSLA